MASNKVVIVGGGSDIARSLVPMLKGFSVKSLSSKELDVTDLLRLNRISREKPDYLISFAGVIEPSKVLGGNISSWHKQINVNLIGAYNVVNAALQANPKCRIIMVGSNAAKTPRAGWSAYCAAKAGLVMFARCLIEEGVDAWIVNMGRTDTKMRRSLVPSEDPRTLMKPEAVALEILNVLIDRRIERVAWLSAR